MSEDEKPQKPSRSRKAPVRRAVKAEPKPARQKLHDRAFGEAADGFGKEIAPVGKEVAKTTVRAVQVAIRYANGLIWGVEEVADWIEEKVTARLSKIPPDQISPPSPRILVPSIQGAILASDKEEIVIREMFANLIAGSMSRATKSNVHPSFVSIVQQMSPDDAAILKFMIEYNDCCILEVRGYSKEKKGRYETILRKASFHDVDNLDKDVLPFVVNLVRSGLIEVYDGYRATSGNLKLIEDVKKQHQDVREDAKIEVVPSGIQLTALGENFVKVAL